MSKIHLGNPKTGRPACGQHASYGTHKLEQVTCQRCAKIGADLVHLCGHKPIHADSLETPGNFCPKCQAWNCTTPNCTGHMRWPEVNALGGKA